MVAAFDRVPDSLRESEQPLGTVTGLLVVGIDRGEQHDWSRTREGVQGCLQLKRVSLEGGSEEKDDKPHE